MRAAAVRAEGAAQCAHEGPQLQSIQNIDIWLALGVVIATALTDAVYVMFTSSVIARKRVAAANWSSLWYTLSSFAVISYTNNWVYVVFAAIGSWIGAYVTMTYPARRGRQAAGAARPRSLRRADRLSHARLR